MKIYSIQRKYDVTICETVYIVGEDENDAIAYARQGNIWDYANDGEEVSWGDSYYLYDTIQDTGEETSE